MSTYGNPSKAMNPETGYDAIKLNLADTIRGVLQLARQRQHSEGAARAQELLARLAEDRFELAVVGRFNGGKSSLMNAVLGQALLPTGIRPLTSVITSVCYGSRPGIEVCYRNGTLTSHGSVADLVRYATEDGNPANEKGVQSVIVQAPIEKLRRGFYFVDTPGIGSDIAANSAATERYIPDADAVIFVTSFDSPMQAEETEFLVRVREHADKIFYIVNKSDLVDGEQRERILDEVRGRIQANGGNSEAPRIFAISARDALAAKLQDSAGDLDSSGLPDLESALWAFLTDGKSREFLIRIVERTRKLLDAERFYVRIGQAGLVAGKTGSARQEFEGRTQEISRRSTALLESAKMKVRFQLPSMLEAELKRWAAEIISELCKRSATTSPPWQEEIGPALAEPWKSWVEHQSRSLASLLLKIAGQEVGEILGLPDTAKKTAADLFKAGPISSPKLASAELLERTRIQFTAAPEPPQNIVSPWWQIASSFQWASGVASRAWMRTAEEAVHAYAEEVRRRTVEVALDWTDRLFREASSRFEVEVAGLISAIESTMAEADGQTLDHLEQSLELLQAAIDRIRETGAPQQDSARGDGRTRPMRCLVCAQLAEATYQFLSHEQYALATDPQQQTRHAQEGGYCTLHAWQYESIASPQGLCLAYAPLLDARAGDLHAAGGATDLAALMRAVEAAFPASQGCRVCRFIAEQERRIASDVAARIVSTADQFHPGLCILHLHSILGAGLPPTSVYELVASEAEALERIARDMRMYALKHDAIRRGLVTEEERNAYLRGLAWVAGERTIARPWPTER
jgi:GTP-binding protein EngB required for normal cell division